MKFLVRKKDQRVIPWNPLQAESKRFTVMYGNPLDRSTWSTTKPGEKPPRQHLLDRITEDLSALGDAFERLLERLPEELSDAPPSIVITHVISLLEQLLPNEGTVDTVTAPVEETGLETKPVETETGSETKPVEETPGA